MAYKLIITERADELLDNSVYYLLHQLNNKQAAIHLLDEIENVYKRLEDNPQQFPLSRDVYLAGKGYREAIISEMDYLVVFNVEADVVNVMGIFHQREKYRQKL
jgi:plasmid stabilization system protein ParE